jgi:N-acetylneuraminic acid mutarotase
MKKKSTFQSAPARHSLGDGGFFNRRTLIPLVLLPIGAFLALLFSNVSAQTRAMPLAHTKQDGDRIRPTGGACPPWAVVADMPLDLLGAGGVSDGTFFYSFGGYSFTTLTTLDVVYRYDPGTNTWDTMASMPQAAIMAAAVYYPPTNKIYVFGGEDVDTGTNYNITRIYDVASNTWLTGANMPDVRSFMGSGYNPGNGKIYLVAGYNTGDVTSSQDDTWEYDPIADTFTSKADFPHPAGGFASGVINGKLYLAGGRDATTLLVYDTWEYDIAADSWTQKARFPGAESNVPGSAVALDALFVFSGGFPFVAPETVDPAIKGTSSSTKAAFDIAMNRSGVKQKPLVPNSGNFTFVYVPAADEWRRISADMNVGRSFPASAFIPNSNKIIAAGGFDGIELITLASAETLEPCVPAPPPACLEGLAPWRIVADYPAGQLESPVVGSDGTLLYSAGGFLTPVGGSTDLVYSYDPLTDTWTPRANLPEPRFGTPGVFAPNVGKFYVFGGADQNLVIRDTTYVYDPVADSWTIGAPMPDNRFRGSIAYYNGKIYVIGGFDGAVTEQNQTWEYDPIADTWDTTRANIPVPMGGSGAAVEGQFIHVLGSYGGGSGSMLHYRYDVVADSWDTRAPLPVNYYLPGAATLSGKIYLIGGGDPFASPEGSVAGLGGVRLKQQHVPLTSYSNVRAYDPITDTWADSQTMNAPHSSTAAAAAGNSLIVVGGGYDSTVGDSNIVEKADACGGGTPTPTPTATATPTPTVTPTPTAPPRPTPTPRPRPTPLPRPTPPG